MRSVVSIFQALAVAVWTAVSTLLTLVILLFTWNSRIAAYVGGHWIWSPGLLAVCGIRLEIQVERNEREVEACIYVSNHASLLDIPAVFRAIPVPLFFIAKKELRKVPFLGWTMMALGMIFIDRGNREKALKSMRQAGAKIKAGKNVISFPEGTRTRTGEIGIFRRGTFILAMEEGIPIVPVGIGGARNCLPSGSYKLRSGKITVHVGRPIPPEKLKEMTVEEAAEYVRREVVRLIPS